MNPKTFIANVTAGLLVLLGGLTFTDSQGITPGWSTVDGRCWWELPGVRQASEGVDLAFDVVANVRQDSTRRGVEIYFRRLRNAGAFDSTTYEFWFKSPFDSTFSHFWPYGGHLGCVRLTPETSPRFVKGRDYSVRYRAGGIGGWVYRYDADSLSIIDSTWTSDTTWTAWSDSGTFVYPAPIYTTHVTLPEAPIESGPFHIGLAYLERFSYDSLLGDSVVVPPDTVPSDTVVVPPDTVPSDTVVVPPPDPDTIPSDTVVVPPGDLAVTNIMAASGLTYATGESGVGPIYMDRSYEFISIDGELLGGISIVTAYADRIAALDDLFLMFEINAEATVYVGVAQAPMAWLADSGFTDSGLRAYGRWSKSDRNFVFYERRYSAGLVTLGTSSNGPMYVVIIKQ